MTLPWGLCVRDCESATTRMRSEKAKPRQDKPCTSGLAFDMG